MSASYPGIYDKKVDMQLVRIRVIRADTSKLEYTVYCLQKMECVCACMEMMEVDQGMVHLRDN